MDLVFDKGLVIQNGSFAVSVSDSEILRSQVSQYLNIRMGERQLSPTFGLSVEPQQSIVSLGLLAERERLNASRYFPGIEVEGSGTTRNAILTFRINDLALGVR